MRKYVVCGLSNRALTMFIQPLLEKYSSKNEIVGLLDTDPKRVEICKEKYPSLENVASYSDKEFDRMIEETNPDAVIVVSRDDTHIDYILTALSFDLDVITEKPMVINSHDAVRVLHAEKKSKGKVTVAFNYRYSPYHRKIKEMVLEGKIGRVTSVDLIFL